MVPTFGGLANIDPYSSFGRTSEINKVLRVYESSNSLAKRRMKPNVAEERPTMHQYGLWKSFHCLWLLHILVDLLKLFFVSRNSFLSMHVCKVTIQDCKEKIKNPERIPDFWEKISEKWHSFSRKSWTFPWSIKIWLEKDFPKIPKENGSGGLNPL
jgi:hypothetical protein